jgi:hypothetical protein
LFGEGEFDRFLDMRRIHDFLVRWFRRVVAFDGFRSDFFFRDKLYRRAEEVLEQPPLFGVEVIEQRYDLGVV